MSKLTEHKEALDDLGILIQLMDMELDLLRNIVYRYTLMHGDIVEGDVQDTPEHFSFDLVEDDGVVKCYTSDHKEIGLMSDYQRILAIMKKLKL